MFQKARFKLTVWYLCIIILITVVFSIVIYNVVSHQIEGLINMQNDRVRRFQPRPVNEFPPPPKEPFMINTEDLQKQEQQLLFTLVFVDLGIFFVAGAAGYFLAGRTLSPIRIMIDEQNQFISDASHELRTPIATLRAEMEGSLLEKHLSEEQSRKLIASNLEELGTLQNLSNSLLTLTKVHSLNGSRKQGIISIREVIDAACKRTFALAEKKNIHVEENIKDAYMKGDKDRLVELFVILLDNAIKYSEKDTHILVSSKKDLEKIYISVKDEGIGISEKDLPHIYKRFFRADKSRSLVEGYGLGLAIAKKETENHHGTITASSQLKKGTTFSLQFPLYSSIK